MLISIIVVNYNSGHQLPRCLASLQRQTWRNFEVIVVDNASTDNSMAHLDAYPEVRKVYNTTNRGFAAGQNQGIAVAQGEYILALNYDLVMLPDFLEQLVNALAKDREAGWACGKMLNMTSDGKASHTIYAVGHVLPPDRFAKLRGNGEVDHGQYDQAEYVIGAPGAAALYKREMVEDISFEGQFFDESFFTWGEDVDVDWRAHNRGWKCLYVPAAVVYHQGHVGEVYQEPFRSFYVRTTIRNRWLMILANERRPQIFSLIAYEWSLLLYVIRAHLVTAYVGAIISSLRLGLTVLRKRSLVSV